MKFKKALIFGISGQDGPYLAKFLLKKRYQVSGISKLKRFKNLKKLGIFKKIKLFSYQDINYLLNKNFDEIYFFGGQSNVVKSFKHEDLTYKSQIEPLVIILEHIRNNKIKSKLLYASSSEIFGNNKIMRKKENSYKQPISPYGLSKYIGFEVIKSYREMFGLPVVL